MSSVTSFMSEDHDRLDEIFKKFHGTVEKDITKAKELFSEFAKGLKTHIAWEEDILFPIFEDKTGMRFGGPTAVMRMEHEQIKNFLNGIEAKLEQENANVAEEEKNLLIVLTAHNDKEESIVYPEIDALITKEECIEALSKLK